jgi:hypothetical protein
MKKKKNPRIDRSLNNQLHDVTQYMNYQVGEKIRHLEEPYALYAAFKRDNIKTRFGWDGDCGMINATSE